MGVLNDVFTKTVLNFAVAVMAATAAVKGGTKLHTSMIRAWAQFCIKKNTRCLGTRRLAD